MNISGKVQNPGKRAGKSREIWEKVQNPGKRLAKTVNMAF